MGTPDFGTLDFTQVWTTVDGLVTVLAPILGILLGFMIFRRLWRVYKSATSH